MPRISAAKMEVRRDSLLAAARKVFAAKGFEAAAISEIAAEAGISDGLIYHYWGSKRGLLLGVLHDFYDRIIAEMEQAASKADGFEGRLTALIRKHLEIFIQDVDLCRLFISEVRGFEGYLGSEGHELNRRYTAVLLRLLSDGKAAGAVTPDIDTNIIRDVIFGGIEHVVWRNVSIGATADLDRITSQISRLLLHGIRQGPAG